MQDGNSLVKDSDELSSDLHTGYLFQTKAEEFIASHYKSYGSSKPFFLYYSMQMVHQPLSAPSSYLDRWIDLTLSTTPSLTTHSNPNLTLTNYFTLTLTFHPYLTHPTI